MVSKTVSIDAKILVVRAQRVMLDADLAKLYGVSTSRLNEQVRRNIKRFPTEFAFMLSDQEVRALISHFATSKGRGGRRKKQRIGLYAIRQTRKP